MYSGPSIVWTLIFVLNKEVDTFNRGLYCFLNIESPLREVPLYMEANYSLLLMAYPYQHCIFRAHQQHVLNSLLSSSVGPV